MIKQEFLINTTRDILGRLEEISDGGGIDEFDVKTQEYMEFQIKKIYAVGFDAGKKWRGDR